MHTRLSAVPTHSRTRGSALIGTLVMVGIVSMSVAVMISSSNRSIRGSRDKILYEEAYQAALSGTHVARAWLIDPELADSMGGDSDLKEKLSDLVGKAKNMNEDIIEARNANIQAEFFGEQFYEEAGFTLGEKLADSRYVLYEFQKSPVVSFVNDDGKEQFDDNLFQGTPANGHRNFVENIRITTPPTDEDSSVSLRKCTFVIESTGVAEYASSRKERVVQQHVLIYPNEPTAPLLSAEQAIITNGGLTFQGNSHANIHWAPVLAKGNVDVKFLAPVTFNALLNTWTLGTSTQGTGEKFNAAGIYTENSYHGFTNQVVDKWLKYMAGSQGKLISDNGELFKNITNVPVTDFFRQLNDGDFNQSGLLGTNLTLAGKYLDAATSFLDPFNSNGLLTMEDGAAEGALSQGLASVDAKVDGFFAEMNYDELKEYAKNHNGYYTYDGSVFRDATGKRVNKLPDMKEQLGVTGTTAYDPLSQNAVADRILFIDGPNQADDPQDVVPNPEYTSSAPLPNFWKGVMYAHGDVSVSGSSSPNYIIRTPDQFAAYRANPTANSTNHYTAKSVFMDGLLLSAGKANLGGNSTVYGTLAAHDGLGVDLGGTPNIFYNSANGEGRLKDDESQVAQYRVIAGSMLEVAAAD